ncbi:MAG: GNAT family N-acetyltransferase [Actinobacteria bacterium]|nr:GNAT family N-acetyltransferase [Actinomycetota bacterium]
MPPEGDYVLRPAREGDGEALTALAAASADTGSVQLAVRYLRDPFEAWRTLHPDSEWVLAETKDGLVVGGAIVVFGEAEIEGEIRRCARLNNLMVHADYRRRGIATALTEWRLERAGPDAVIAAGIQTGNEGSFANARKWATQIFGTLVLPGFRVGRHGAPRGLEIREPREDSEWEEAAAGLDAFESGWNLRIPETASSLRGRAGRAPFGERVQRQLLALEGGRVVGGCELFEGARLQSIVVEHVPPVLRALNLMVRLLPREGVLRTASVSRLWHAPERADVGRALWAYGRSAAAGTSNAIGTQFDPRGPLGQLVPMRPWTVKGRLAVAVRSPVRLSEDRLLAPP